MEPAASSKPQNAVFKEIIKTLQCQICLNTMTDPHILPCGHNFCRECIKDLATAQSNRSSNLRCPNNCHKTICIQLVKDLPRNFTLCSIIESMNQAKRCESHDDYVGFINITDGKLLCEHCLKNEQTHPVAQANPSATPSTTATIPSLSSLPPGILTLSMAEDVVKSDLETFIIQSKSLVAQMKSLETQFLEAGEESKRGAKRQIDSMFNSFTSALSDQQARLTSLVDGIDVRNHVLSKAITTISKTAEDTSVVFNAQHGQAAQEKLILFLTSAIQLQSSFAPDLDVASKALDAAKNLKTPSILVTCPTMPSLLVTLRSMDLFKITKADDIPVPQRSRSTGSEQNFGLKHEREYGSVVENVEQDRVVGYVEEVVAEVVEYIEQVGEEVEYFQRDPEEVEYVEPAVVVVEHVEGSEYVEHVGLFDDEFQQDGVVGYNDAEPDGWYEDEEPVGLYDDEIQDRVVGYDDEIQDRVVGYDAEPAEEEYPYLEQDFW